MQLTNVEKSGGYRDIFGYSRMSVKHMSLLYGVEENREMSRTNG